MMVVDKAADYGRSIASLNDSLLKRRKLEDDVDARNKGNSPEGGPVDVRIHVVGATVEQPAETPPDVPPG